MSLLETREMFEKASYREKYAMEHGTKETVYCGVDKHKCYKFTYSSDDEYQDANGALYDTVTKSWRD